MRKNIHPNYKPLKVKVGDKEILLMSTYEGDQYLVEVDYTEHPAWTKKGFSHVSATNKNIAKFNKKFQNLSFAKNS